MHEEVQAEIAVWCDALEAIEGACLLSGAARRVASLAQKLQNLLATSPLDAAEGISPLDFSNAERSEGTSPNDTSFILIAALDHVGGIANYSLSRSLNGTVHCVIAHPDIEGRVIFVSYNVDLAVIGGIASLYASLGRNLCLS